MAEPDDAVFHVLGVPRDADEETVKRAHRMLAARYHPDRNPGDAEAERRFHEVNRAYAEWSSAASPESRQARTSAAASPESPQARASSAASPESPQARASSDGSGKPFQTASEIFDQFKDLFGEFFAGGQPAAPARGADRRQPLKLSYPEARDGCTRSIDVLREVVCGTCSGTGSLDGTSKVCARCLGTRTIRHTHGVFEVAQACPDCGGTGRYILDPCERCERGLRPSAETVEVKVPPGVESGTHLRIAGKGDEHPGGGPPGDLYLEIEVDLLEALVPRGDDVVIQTAVRARHVLLGGALDVRGLDGNVAVQVPRGVRDGDSIKLAGRGNVRTSAAAGGPPSGDPYRDVARGDQIVVFRVPPEAERARRTAVGVGAAVVAVLIAILASLLR